MPSEDIMLTYVHVANVCDATYVYGSKYITVCYKSETDNKYLCYTSFFIVGHYFVSCDTTLC